MLLEIVRGQILQLRKLRLIRHSLKSAKVIRIDLIEMEGLARHINRKEGTPVITALTGIGMPLKVIGK